MRSPSLLLWMLLAILGVAGVAYWDATREATAALDELGQEQATVASALARTIATRDSGDVLPLLRGVERPGSLVVLVQREGSPDFTTTSGDHVVSPVLDGRSGGFARLSRNDAAAIGLPARTAMAGFATAPPWRIVVVSTALHERDRAIRAGWRLVLSVLVASGLVIAFGGIAMRKQRKELELERELAVTAIEQQRDERLVRADKLGMLGALASGVAHEVSTPLAVILGRAEQLEPKLGGDERAMRAVRTIQEQGKRIDEIVRGFLSLARGNAAEHVRVTPASLVEHATELVEHRFAKAGVHLVTEVGRELPLVACEPRMLEQVLVNLLLNACDACDPGGTVELRVAAGGAHVTFVVADDGEGITTEHAARATEPFFTTKPAGKGTGLGLAIANEIVKHHNGTLVLVANEPRGTRAIVELPVAA